MYLTQLRQAGVLEKVQGILLGDFSEWGEPEHGFGMEDFLGEWFKGLQIPVIGNVCSDRRTPMGTLPLGAVCHVISERGLSGEARISFFR